jgi:DNA-directed RNA polymerase specialized sigma24 family protein
VLRYFDDLTETQTADLLQISVGTVKSQARDALARLRALVPDLDADVIGSDS